MNSSPPSNPGFGGGLSDVVTTLKNIVIAINNLNQNLNGIFASDFVSSTVLSGSAVSLTSATPANVTSISLVGGDWDVWGNIGFVANAATTATVFEGGINTVSATLPTSPGAGAYAQYGLSVAAAGTEPAFSIGMTRINITTTTTVYLVAQSTFAVNSMSVFGFLGARLRGV